jgi:hypothetical protein
MTIMKNILLILAVLNGMSAFGQFYSPGATVGNSSNASARIDHNGAATYGILLQLNQNAIGNSDGPKIEFNKTMTTGKEWTLGIMPGVNVGDFAINEDGSWWGGFGTPRFVVKPGGYIGVGTTTPDQRLTVMGNVTLESGDNPILNTGTGTSELNRYLQLINSSGYGSASGLKAGGVLVADNYSYASPSKNDLIVKGNVGIGVASPSYKLQVVGGAVALDADQPLRGGGTWLISGNGSQVTVGSAYTGVNFRVDAGATSRMFINGTSGNVGIGTANPDQKLTVNGTVHATRVKVETTVPGPDYVFEKDYELPSLEQIKSYIDENKHLPDVPSAKEMAAKGIDVEEMNMLLLKKVEELTLYVIRQESETSFLKEKITLMESELQKIKK